MPGNTKHQREGSDKKATSEEATADMQSDHEAARAALSMVDQQKRAVVKRLHIPWWQGPLIGVSMAMLVVSHAAATPFNLLLVAIACVGIFVMLRQYTSQPVWVSGWRKGKTRALSVTFFIIYLFHYFGSMWLASRGHSWIIPATAVSIFVTAIVYGHLWLAVWRKDMEADDVS